MKISKIIIPSYNQFQSFEIDLTYPENHQKAGQPLEKVCFIGKNGTGKSTILELINSILRTNCNYPILGNSSELSRKIILKTQYSYKSFYLINSSSITYSNNPKYILDSIEKDNSFSNEILLMKSSINGNYGVSYLNSISDKFTIDNTNYLFKNNSNDLVIYSPSKSSKNDLISISDVPQVTLNQALELFKEFSFYQEVSNQNISEFWKLLIYLIKKREDEYNTFQNLEENQDKTIRELKQDFDKNNPEILQKISEIWNLILDKAGLEFDYKNASNPIQLNDNLKAYIKIKNTNEIVPYNNLSTGIRNFIFRIGYIYSLYFNRNIDRGFLLIDEPENSLYPDFLYDLIEIYQKISKNTQIFVATHSPIIATQFEPEERIILEFNEDGNVTAHKGISPTGDDPNDILKNDFTVRNVLGKEGLEKWNRFIKLKSLIKNAQNSKDKK